MLLHLQLYLVSQLRKTKRSRSRMLSKWWPPKSSEEKYTDEEQAAFTEEWKQRRAKHTSRVCEPRHAKAILY